MTTSLEAAESILTVDLGSVTTRAALFDIVEGRYAFVAAASTPATINAPFRDVTTSLLDALEMLSRITGRLFVDDKRMLIHPSRPDGSGVDMVVMTFTASPELRILTAGLGEISLASAESLAATASGHIVETISLGDHRSPEEQISAIVNARPDLIIFSGGMDNGASRSVFKVAEQLMFACRLLPESQRPVILYTGNQQLASRIADVLGRQTKVVTAPNIQSEIGVESLAPSQEIYGELLCDIRSRQIGGFQKIASVCGVPPQPAEHTLGRMVRFLSRVYDPAKGVLGVDIGASHTTAAAAVGGDLTLNVLPVGLGTSLPRLLEQVTAEEVARWSPIHLSAEDVRDHFWQKSLYPALVPVTREDLAMEQAAARVLLKLSAAALRTRKVDLPQSFEPVIAGGAVFTRAASPAQALLTLIDGLQPVGVTTFILDLHGLMSGLGAAAKANAVLPVQVMESGAFANLGTVISPLCSARTGVKGIHVRMETIQGDDFNLEVTQGDIVRIPLPPGQAATIHLEPMNGARIAVSGRHGSQSVKISGGMCGAVIDTRGRPLKLPGDDARRADLFAKWLQDLEQPN